ncbi:hypothetical protein QBC46DRAFT_369299 [Diplogelasinospora grovesii]|uniref:F-box domain-containing protein n=1 Tax=Diplogelasinospora grovesii TaxID=303347 RepID=A0AAN6SAW2_9PEZI|nr:hypothetical protein QBC46DRAFT_369299 [Diplogelasinospora grovesii]
MAKTKQIISKLNTISRLSDTGKPSYNSTHLNSPLEDLPAEIRLQILSVLGLEELRTLVRASPVFHQQYLANRRYILRKYLETTLIVDAHTVYRSSLAEFQNKRTLEEVTRFLDAYHDRRSSLIQRPTLVTAKLTEDEAIDMVVFYSSIIKPFARRYASNMIAELARAAEWTGERRRSQWAPSESQDERFSPPSRREETRILRALYRFQLCCNLFGLPPLHAKYPHTESQEESFNLSRHFLRWYEPWEREEIACIYAFSERKYETICCDIRRKQEGEWLRTGPKDFNLRWTCRFHSTWRQWPTDQASCGLELLHTVVCTTRDNRQLISTMRKHMLSRPREVVPADFGSLRVGGGGLDRSDGLRGVFFDKTPKERFRGDDPNVLGPPPIWSLLAPSWNFPFAKLLYFRAQPRRLGPVMWDAARLERTGVLRMIAGYCD